MEPQQSKALKGRYLWPIAAIGFAMMLWVLAGTMMRRATLAELGTPTYGQDACVEIYFQGPDQRWQQEVYELLEAKMPYEDSQIFIETMSHAVPLFRCGYIRLSLDVNRVADVESQVRTIIEESFPDLTVAVESHTTAAPAAN